MTDLTATARKAVADLDWCNTVPHTIDGIIGIHAEQTRHQGRALRHGLTNDQILDALATGGGGPSGSGYSDPTSAAALRNEPDAADDLELGAIDAALALIYESAIEIDQVVTEACGLPRPSAVTPHGRQHHVSASAAHLMYVMPNLTRAHALTPDPDHLVLLVRTALAETTTWLRDKAEGIWLSAKGDRQTPAVQRAIVECTTCSRWRKGTVAVRRGQCNQCARFQEDHKCKATEAIVRRWELGKGPTPALILEAKTPTPGRHRKATA